MKNILKYVQIFLYFSAIVYANLVFCSSDELKQRRLHTLFHIKIEGTINPASLSHLKEALKKVRTTPYSGILIQMNTPGGLVSVTKAMITEIGKSKAPFVVFVGPEGSSATSAGAILSAASHQLFMSPGTNIGAATPINLNEEMPKDSRAKAINDLVALVTSLREARQKEASPFKSMITEAKSYTAQEATKLSIADAQITDLSELPIRLNEKIIIIGNQKVKLDTRNLIIKLVEMDLGQKILNLLASPELAYLLFLLGAALIYFELQAAGGFIAGGLGVIFLILAAVSFQVIPLNMGGLGLILLSFALFFLEVYITSFGLLSLAGLASLVTGSLFLFRTNDAYFELSKTVIFSTTAAIVSFMAIIVTIVLKNKKQLSQNFNDMLPKTGLIIKVLEEKNHQFHYQIRAEGEIWHAISKHEFKLDQTVAIEKKDGNNMAYIIRPFEKY